MTSDNSISSAAKRLLPALAQSNPISAGICRLYDDQKAAEKDLNLTRALQVIEHRIGVNKAQIVENEERLVELTRLVLGIPIEKSELHATICASLAAGGILTDEVALANFFISKLAKLDFLELLALFGESGMLPEQSSIEQRSHFMKNYPDHYESIVAELKSQHLLVGDGTSLPGALQNLLTE